ncbi:MAG TPA: archaellin/type IV pilin N-terminal domain-containing protein [Dehalococcoidia bacterium]|nr:archaellin/type IV pilin N-terminal domain-containing protein [Dehalococcoidia bacterium]
MSKIRKLLGSLHKREEGITGLETAIILIAFVIVASVFAFVVLSTGLFSAERGKETVFAGLEKARGNLEVRGAVTVTDVNADGAITNAGADTIIFNVGLAAGGFPVLLDPTATTNTLALNYIDAQARIPLAGVTDWTATEVMGDGDNLLEVGELFSVTVTMPAGASLDTNEIFTVEVIPPSGGALLINRTMPPQVDLVMDLH